MKKLLAVCLACCMLFSLAACGKKAAANPAFDGYDVSDIVRMHFSNIDSLCDNAEQATSAGETLRVMQESGDLLLSFVVDSAIALTSEELAPYDHLVYTNPQWIERFGDPTALKPVEFSSLTATLQDFVTAQMPLWTADGSVLPAGVSFYEYDGDKLLTLPANVGSVDAIEAEHPLLVVIDEPASVMRADTFLLPLASSGNLIFTSYQQLQSEIEDGVLFAYVSALDAFSLSAG